MGRTSTGDFELDYPPLRFLLIDDPLGPPHRTPGSRHRSLARILAAELQPRREIVWNWPDEDLARPILLVNTSATAGSAVAAFFLVWIWVHRGGRPNLPGKPRKLAPWKPTSPAKANGLILFPWWPGHFFTPC